MQQDTPDIAIIGLACRLAGANSPPELWDNLLMSKDVQRRMSRFHIDGYYHQHGGSLKGLTNVDRAYMLDDDAIHQFDNAFFHITPTEAAAMDPQQRILLELSYEAIENAGIPLHQFTGTDTAVFTGTLGIEGSDYHTIVARDIDATPKYVVTGTAGCMASNRLSYFYDLSGPSMTVDTACSSSMAALHQAVRTLQHGDSKMAMVCGANLILNPESFITMTELGFLGPGGRCRSFDANANGYGRGEGICCLLLMPLAAASSTKAPIRAVIKGTRLNQDGRTQGITLPSAKAQARNMSSLYHELSIDPRTIQYLEAHGTGTAAGDPLEMQAVKETYMDSHLVVGSVKSNVGHCEAASALVGLIKLILCLEHGQIPRQMHFATLNPNIDLTGTNITIPMQVLPWPPSSSALLDRRRAAINTFGAGGTNGHAVLESYPSRSITVSNAQRPWLFKISAADESSLQYLTSSYATYLDHQTPDLQDLAHTLLAHRSSLRYSYLFVASSRESLVAQLRSGYGVPLTKRSNVDARLLFVFTGQGAQWARMGYSLLDKSPLFRMALQACDDTLQGLPHPPAWSIFEELSKTRGNSNVNEAQYSQPLCTALQIGLVALLQSWGIRPTAVAGHSSGEIGAAYAAGMISLETAITVAYYRGYVLVDSSDTSSPKDPQGSMCAVNMSEDECSSILKKFDGHVQLAAVNSPQNCTLSGDRESIQQIVDTCAEQGRFCRRLKVDKAYHSHHMSPYASSYEHRLIKASVVPLQSILSCAMFSSVTGHKVEGHDLLPSYWARNMTSTVRFLAALDQCLVELPDIDGVLEIGPHPALKGPIQDTFHSHGNSGTTYFSTCKRETDDFESILRSTGEMIAAGVPCDASAVNAEVVVQHDSWEFRYGNVLTDLPTYRWNHSTPFWSESRLSQNVRFRRFPRHELLGSRYVDDIPPRACWRNILDPKTIAWLGDCKGDDLPGLSPAVCVLMATEAARQSWMSNTQEKPIVRLTNMEFLRPILETAKMAQKPLETQLISKMDGSSSRLSFEILSATPNVADQWQLCATGHLELDSTMPELSDSHASDINHDPLLVRRVKSVYPSILNKVEILQMSKDKTRGVTLGLQQSWQEYPLHPLALASVLSLGPKIVVDHNLPVRHRISSIPILEIRIKPQGSDTPNFVIDTQSDLAGGAVSNIGVFSDVHKILSGTFQYVATEVIHAKPITTSLFFKPACLPDITKPMAVQKMSLAECVRLLSHKWPMSDTVVAGVSAKAQRFILGIFKTQQPGERRGFRSISILGDAAQSKTDASVRQVCELGPDLQAHMIFVGRESSVRGLLQHVQPSAFICSCDDGQESETSLSGQCDRVCEVTGPDEEPWTLWQTKTDPPCATTRRQRIIFGNQAMKLKDAVQINLRPEHTNTFISQPSRERFDAVVMDDLGKSIIATWSGSELIPWIQYLMIHAESLLWVTLDSSSNPFVDIAGTLLRTLQAEQPSLKVSWVCLNHSQMDEKTLMEKIESGYTSMIIGENEVRQEVDRAETRIIRYLPDERLSAATGVALPREVPHPIGQQDYALALAAPKEPVILSHNQSTDLETKARDDKDHSPQANPKHRVLVTASVLGGDDIAAYKGLKTGRMSNDHQGNQCTTALGTFFSGEVLTSTSRKFLQGSFVVGWTRGAHKNAVDIPERNLYFCASRDHPQLSVASFASLAIAMTTLDGHVRARNNDRLQLRNMGPILSKAFSTACEALSVGEDCNDRSPTFVIEVAKNGEILVDTVPVDIPRYLSTNPTSLRDLWENKRIDQHFISRAACYSLEHHPAAFEDAATRLDPIVLLHKKFDGMTHVPIYRPPNTLFSPIGAYIIIGGLGGLGRYACSWLVDHGATCVYAISRSGISSSEAQALYDDLNSRNGISLEVIKADACDRTSISEILTTIRAKVPIKGIINMAMILGDAPMASMTGEEWDRALRVKIESSWILHEETKDDDLEFFVLLSSIASVLGNRNQGSYNVGNTFLNALATYRRRMGKTAVAIALGAMTDIGVLSTYATSTTPLTLTRSGLTHLTTAHLDKILEAAFYKSRQQLAGEEAIPEDAICVTGLDMWEDDGSKEGQGGEVVYWRGCPEFGHLADYKPRALSTDNTDGKALTLKEKIAALLASASSPTTTVNGGDAMRVDELVTAAFLAFLSSTLGFPPETFDTGAGLAMYGLDSLNAVAVQYWCFREIGVSVSVSEVFATKSIAELVGIICTRISS